MSDEVLESIAGQIMHKLDVTTSQIEKDNLNLETVNIICGNIHDHLSQALQTADTQETSEEKLQSLVSSIQTIRQAIVNEPQKLQQLQRDLELKRSVYSEVLELIRTTAPPPRPPTPPVRPEVHLNLGSLGSKIDKDE
jgi:uncharacterized protein involved in exopolysaccharide biosynthesis